MEYNDNDIYSQPMYDPIFSNITKDNTPEYEAYRRTIAIGSIETDNMLREAQRNSENKNPIHNKQHIPEMYEVARKVFREMSEELLSGIEFSVSLAVDAIVDGSNKILLGSSTKKVLKTAIMKEIKKNSRLLKFK